MEEVHVEKKLVGKISIERLEGTNIGPNP